MTFLFYFSRFWSDKSMLRHLYVWWYVNVYLFVSVLNSFPHTTNCAADDFENILAKVWNTPIYESWVIKLSWKHCGKRRNCSSWAISPFARGFSKVVCCRGVIWRKGLILWHICHISILKTVWEKEKLLIMSYQPFSIFEIAHYEQFLLLPEGFQKLSAAEASYEGKG